MFAPQVPPIDPTMPGLSVRDLRTRPIHASESGPATGEVQRHRDFQIRHSLEQLGRRALRDLGLERDAV